jgi:hypothetical protein
MKLSRTVKKWLSLCFLQKNVYLCTQIETNKKTIMVQISKVKKGH